ncbi:MAG TPA: carboxypeptidase-like regulatory domain-containing protein, partial [bacterium]|nr:carboxypeptidase-like regulatory domain-containing protein [bacterium]
FGDDKALRGSYLLRKSNNLDFIASWNPDPDLNLDFWYTKYNFDSDNSESDSYNCSFHYSLPNKHRIGVQVCHYTGDLREDETSYMLTYTIPLGIPICKKKNVGSIKGIVYDAESPDKKGISGVILRVNGKTAVTNSKGEYIFPSAVPGSYQIYVDRSSIGLDKITEQKLPITVEVKVGKSSNVDIGVVRSCNVFGKVIVIPGNNNENNGNGGVVIGEPGGKNGKKEPEPLANVLVELTNGEEVMRRTTNQKGEFLFDNVRPGSWHIKVYDHNLPSYHYLETPEQDITLKPGQNKEITIRVLPKIRQIKFIDEGVIQSNNNHK